MSTIHLARLHERGVIAIEGPDRVAFLQGLTSNDVGRAGADRAVFSTFLTPQGKFLHDFFVLAEHRPGGERLLLEMARERLGDLERRLRLYKLRSQVTLEDASDAHAVFAAWSGGEDGEAGDATAAFGLPYQAGAARAVGGGIAFVDPRTAAMGVRLVLPAEEAETAIADRIAADRAVRAEPEAYDAHRIALGVPDGLADLEAERSTLLEAGYDRLNAIDWQKGCYMGQELTARMRYRGLVKKALQPVTVEGKLPPSGTPIVQDGREVGVLRSGRDGRAIALLRLDAAEKAEEEPLLAADARVWPAA